MVKFLPDARQSVLQHIEGAIAEASRLASINKGWVTGFKIAVLLLGIAVVVCSTVASNTLFKNLNTAMWSFASAICGGISAALAAFSDQQLELPKRQKVYIRKVAAPESLKFELSYSDPCAKDFGRRLAAVLTWGDDSDPTMLVLPPPN